MNHTTTPTLTNKEQRRHSSTLLPYSIYECRIPDSFPNVPMHWHDEFELDYILEGNGDFICGDERFLVNQADVIMIPPNIAHAAYPSSNTTLTYLAFVFHANMIGLESNDRSSNSCIRPLITGQLCVNTKYDATHKDYATIRDLTKKIIDCANTNTPYDDLLLKSMLLQLFWYFEKNDNLTTSRNKNSSYSSLIRPALEHMTYFYADTITIDQLSALCSISPSHFMNSFKKAVGCSALDYLIHIRIKAACTELKTTTNDISTIAFGCGFNNLSNFNKQFKKITGSSPFEYRTTNL